MRHAYQRTAALVTYIYENPTKCSSIEQIGHHHHMIEMQLVFAMIQGHAKQYSIVANFKNHDLSTDLIICLQKCYHCIVFFTFKI